MSEKRKNDHLDLAINSQVQNKKFALNYEPMLSGHPKNVDLSIQFNTFKLHAPIWFSSMTGGAMHAKTINTNLAKIASKYSLGMGLGSCRSLLDTDTRLNDFSVKEYLLNGPLYTNLGIAQLEQIVNINNYESIIGLQKRLNADGLIIHVNPLQEWAQPEGDRYYESPINTIKQLLEHTDIPIVVKEVGQGFGPKSIKELAKLDLQAIEFASLGGTNFTLLEQARHVAPQSGKKQSLEQLAYVGHTKEEMISFYNDLDPRDLRCKNVIISGGVHNSVEGFRLMSLIKANSLIGYGSVLLNYAKDLNALDEFIHSEIENLKLASCLFEVSN